MTDWDPAEFTRALVADMRAHGGRPASGPMAGKPLIVLTTTGARTGEPRTSIVTYHRDGDRYAIAASMGGAPKHPAWYHNLVANPEATIEVDNETFKVRATDTSGPERDRLWNEHVAQLPEFGEYPKKTDRTIPMLLLDRIA
ncbi:MAG TPA: nitroreductase family deazaflavin-dependent oxidoreductase [Candidatus Bathyarchaeia archaeon]|jgi:deazaflavin-dependent oxidoreductase (nitroreductase family)|nr:nitroreductase family deazaflavin-dependent oxidoreductase [Candidatus Bathyarchaeia archaeon]